MQRARCGAISYKSRQLGHVSHSKQKHTHTHQLLSRNLSSKLVNFLSDIGVTRREKPIYATSNVCSPLVEVLEGVLSVFLRRVRNAKIFENAQTAPMTNRETTKRNQKQLKTPNKTTKIKNPISKRRDSLIPLWHHIQPPGQSLPTVAQNSKTL